MALDETGQIQETAEKRQVTTETLNPTILEKLRRFAQTRAQVLALMAGIAAPVAVGCATEPDAIQRPESTVQLNLSLNIIQQLPKGFVGVTVFSELNEPLNDTSFKLIDANGATIDDIERPIQPGDNSITFVDSEYAMDSEVAVDNGSEIRVVVVSGYDAQGNLVQNEISVPTYMFDSFNE